MKTTALLFCYIFGLTLVAMGLWAIYPPVCLIVGGMSMLLLAYTLDEGGAT